MALARLLRTCLPGVPHHVIQRGNNRQLCFGCEEDFAAYAHWLHQYASQYRVSIHAWVFMTNHVHLLLTPTQSDGISRLMQSLGRSYVRYFNKRYDRSGTLWEGRFKSCVVDSESYLLICQRYIEMNPLRAGMVKYAGEYRWSSFQANGMGREIKLWTPHPVYLQLGNSSDERCRVYRLLHEHPLDGRVLGEIRESLKKELALGGEQFRQQVTQLTGRRQQSLKRGPKSFELLL
jgi:putative transposase